MNLDIDFHVDAEFGFYEGKPNPYIQLIEHDDMLTKLVVYPNKLYAFGTRVDDCDNGCYVFSVDATGIVWAHTFYGSHQVGRVHPPMLTNNLYDDPAWSVTIMYDVWRDLRYEIIEASISDYITAAYETVAKDRHVQFLALTGDPVAVLDTERHEISIACSAMIPAFPGQTIYLD